MSETPQRPSEGRKPANVIDLRTLLTVRLSRDGKGQAVTVIARTREGSYYEAGRWLWEDISMPESLLLDLLNTMGIQLTTALVQSCGIQAVLEGMPSVP